MNFFYGISNDLFKSEIQIPLFQNRNFKKSNLKLFKSYPKNNKWILQEISNKKTFIYVGQDSLCRGVNYYFGSSILTSFCHLAYDRNIFKKEILLTLEKIVKKELDAKEWDCIYEARRECKKNGKDWHNINGKVQIHN